MTSLTKDNGVSNVHGARIETETEDKIVSKQTFEKHYPSSHAYDLLKPRWSELTKYILAMSIGSLQVGWAILGNTQTALILAAQFEWAEEDVKFYNSVLGNCGLVGVMIGSLFGGPLITDGRRRAILFFSVVMCVGVGLTLIQTFYTMCLGRLITGFSGGILQMCNIKAVQETFPSTLVGLYGSSSGAFLAIGVFVVALIGGVTLPANEEDYMEDKMWRLSYAFPLVWVAWQVLMVTTTWKYEPIDYLIRNNRDEEARKFLPMIWDVPEGHNIDTPEKRQQHFNRFIQERRQELLKAQAAAAKITFKDAVFGKDYAKATWMASGLNIGNQFSAIGPVCIYSSTILKEVIEETNGEFPITIREGVLIVGATTMISAILGALPARYYGRRLILWTSHLALAITHAIIAVLYAQRSFVAMYVFMQVFIFCFYIGTGNVSFIYAGEACVDQAMGVVLGVRWMTEMFMSFTISFMLASKLGVVYTFWIYSILNFAAFLFMLQLKETRGKTPQQLKELYWPESRKTTQQSTVNFSKVTPVSRPEARGETELATPVEPA